MIIYIISRKFHVNMIKCALQTNTSNLSSIKSLGTLKQIKHEISRIPTVKRLTSWLLTKHGGVEYWATKNKSS